MTDWPKFISSSLLTSAIFLFAITQAPSLFFQVSLSVIAGAWLILRGIDAGLRVHTQRLIAEKERLDALKELGAPAILAMLQESKSDSKS